MVAGYDFALMAGCNIYIIVKLKHKTKRAYYIKQKILVAPKSHVKK